MCFLIEKYHFGEFKFSFEPIEIKNPMPTSQ